MPASRDGVFVLGSFVVDAAYRATRMPGPGETVLGQSFALGPGGKGSNQAVAAARAGARVALQTAIGDDAFGRMGRELWAAEGIDAEAVRMVEVGTGSAAILLDEETGANRILVVPGACHALRVEDVEGAQGAIREAKVFVAQLEVPLAVVARGLELARSAGVTTVLNPAPAPTGALPEDLLRQVDFLIPNETEAERLTGIRVDGHEAAEEAGRRLLAAGANQVVVTMGEQGALLVTREGGIQRQEAFRLGTVHDTTGAGDALCGAFAAALAEGMESVSALRFASAAAGLSVLRHGAAPSMPRRGEIEAVLRQGGL